MATTLPCFHSQVFGTISDSNIDYTSPSYFNRESRTILRVGELRVSSNIISPSGPVQAMKFSVADVSLHLSNTRQKHNVENSHLSFAKTILSPADLNQSSLKAGFNYDSLPRSREDAMYKMKFITVATLDCFDAAVASSNTKGTNDIPDAIITLSIGCSCLYTCRDSFACLTETINEVVLKLTMPSAEEMEAMKELQDSIQLSRTGADHTISNNEEEETAEVAHQVCSSSYSSIENAVQDMTLNDAMEEDLFSGSFDARDANTEKDQEGSIQNIQYFDQPLGSTSADSDLSASQLRLKYDIVDSPTKLQTEVIKDYYAIDSKEVEMARDEQRQQDAQSPMRNQIPIRSTDVSLLGEEEWTSVDHAWSNNIPDNEEQHARWYVCDDENHNNEKSLDEPYLSLPDNATIIVRGDCGQRQPQIFPRHVPINPVSDPLSGGDMGAADFIGSNKAPHVKLRLIIKDLSLNCRFYDGYDWSTKKVKPPTNHKTQLLGELLGDQNEEGSSLFKEVGDESNGFGLSTPCRRKKRQSDRFFQFAVNKIRMRTDSFEQKKEYNLASCMDLTVSDFSFSETLSSGKLVKMMGEWTSEEEHPRDSNDGILMMKVCTLYVVRTEINSKDSCYNLI